MEELQLNEDFVAKYVKLEEDLELARRELQEAAQRASRPVDDSQLERLRQDLAEQQSQRDEAEKRARHLAGQLEQCCTELKQCQQSVEKLAETQRAGPPPQFEGRIAELLKEKSDLAGALESVQLELDEAQSTIRSKDEEIWKQCQELLEKDREIFELETKWLNRP